MNRSGRVRPGGPPRGHFKYRAVMEQKRSPGPEDLVIAGCSGSAWGAALLADDVIGRFPERRRITCFIDSARGFKDDWPRIATEVWGAPDEIVARLHPTDIVRDSLAALYRSLGDRVHFLYSSSIRDSALVRMQNHFDRKGLVFTRGAGEEFQRDAAEMSLGLMREVPSIGLDCVDTPDSGTRGTVLTTHCLIRDKSFHRRISEGKAPATGLGMP